MTSALCLTVAFLIASGVAGQWPPAGGRTRALTSATRVISPVAVVTWATRAGDNGADELDVMVLWRGSPGWFMRGDGSGGSTGGDAKAWHATITHGGLELQLRFDSRTRVAHVQGTRLELGDANVILVDGVDAARGPRVVGTVRLDAVFRGPTHQIEPMLRASPELLDFLRCDAPLPPGQVQRMLAYRCSQLAGAPGPDGHKPDFCGDWVLVEPLNPGPQAVSELKIRHAPPFADISIQRISPDGVRTDSYTIGVEGGTVAGLPHPDAPVLPETRHSVRWDGTMLVIQTGTYWGRLGESGRFAEREETWTLDADGRLHVTATDRASDAATETATLIYRRR